MENSHYVFKLKIKYFALFSYFLCMKAVHVLGQDTKMPQANLGETQEIHECVICCLDMTEIMLKVA